MLGLSPLFDTIVFQDSMSFGFNIKIILYQLEKQILSFSAHMNISNTPHTRVIGRRRWRRKLATLFKCLIKAFCCSYGGNEFLMLSSPIRWLLWWFWLNKEKAESKIYFLTY